MPLLLLPTITAVAGADRRRGASTGLPVSSPTKCQLDIMTDTRCTGCGKGGDALKPCNVCGLFTSTAAASGECKLKHLTSHELACKERAAELYDEKLFAEPPPKEDCPVCFLPMPLCSLPFPIDRPYDTTSHPAGRSFALCASMLPRGSERLGRRNTLPLL